MEDSDIVDLYLAKNEAAITMTAQKYGTQLKRIAARITESVETAEECENDAYLETWNLIPPNEPRDYLFAFVGRIVRHLAINQCRRENRQKRQALYCELTTEMQECIPSQKDVEAEFLEYELRQMINTFLGHCSEEQRTVFVRRYWFFDSISEISKSYGYSQSKVKTMLFRMRGQLRDYLNQRGYDL